MGQRNYRADRMVIAAAGPVDHAHFTELTGKYFGGFQRSSSTDAYVAEEKPTFCSGELLYRAEEPGGTAHFAVGYEGVPWTHPDSITFMIIQSIMGNYKKGEGLVPPKLSGNRLTNSMANNVAPGLVDSFAAFNTCYKDTGLFGFYAQCDESVVNTCIDELLFGVNRLAHSVTEEEVERGKRQLKTTLFGSLDSTTAIAEDIGRQLLVYGRRIPIAEFLLRLDAINATEVKRVAKKHLCDTSIAITGLGPLEKLPSLVELRNRTGALQF